MDKVTHFLVLVALVLFIVIMLLWLIGSSCTAGYAAGHMGFFAWIRGFAGKAKDVAGAVKKHFKNNPSVPPVAPEVAPVVPQTPPSSPEDTTTTIGHCGDYQ